MTGSVFISPRIVTSRVGYAGGMIKISSECHAPIYCELLYVEPLWANGWSCK
jgi:hypothetical protein